MALFQDVALAIFDMDGLLLDTERLGIRVALETARRVGFPLTEEDVLATVGMTWEATHRYYRARYPQADGLEAFVDANKKAYEQALIDGEIPLKPGSLALVDRLLGRGVRCVVATSNSWERAHLCLKKRGFTIVLNGCFAARMFRRASRIRPFSYLPVRRAGSRRRRRSCWRIRSTDCWPP